MSQVTDALKALADQVAASVTVEQSAIQLMNGFADRVNAAVAAAIAANPAITAADLQGITDETAALQASAAAMAAAVTANTPAAPTAVSTPAAADPASATDTAATPAP